MSKVDIIDRQEDGFTALITPDLAGIGVTGRYATVAAILADFREEVAASAERAARRLQELEAEAAPMDD